MADAVPLEVVEEEEGAQEIEADVVRIHCLLGGSTLTYPAPWIHARRAALAARYPEFAEIRDSYTLLVYGPAFATDAHLLEPEEPKRYSLADVVRLIEEKRYRYRFMCRRNAEVEQAIATLLSDIRTVVAQEGLTKDPWDLFGFLAALQKGNGAVVRQIDAALANRADYQAIARTLTELAFRDLGKL